QDLVDAHLRWLLRWVGRPDLAASARSFRKIDSVLRTGGAREIRLDNAWLHEGDEGDTRTAIGIEVQRYRDVKKIWRCDEYLSQLTAHYHCKAILLFLTPDERVARWARPHLADISRVKGRTYVLGPADIAEDHPDIDARGALSRSTLLA